MDWSKYHWNPWSVSKRGLLDIEEVLVDNDIHHIVEFGSGASTYYMRDVLNRLGRDYNLLSFDDSRKYAADGAIVRPLMRCSDESFEEMFDEGVYKPQHMWYYIGRKHSRQHNCFYKMMWDDFTAPIDFMLVDGPNGNGRSFAFLHTKDQIGNGSIIFIDDYDHYDFLDRLSLFHDYSIMKKVDAGKDRYAIVKIIGDDKKNK